MNGLKPIKIPSAKEKVASELRKAILSRKMKEGEILSLDSVATQLNVSITPVREAFQILLPALPTHLAEMPHCRVKGSLLLSFALIKLLF